MPAYQYEALDADGKTVKGLLDADSAKAARVALRAKQLAPLVVEQAVAGNVDASAADGERSASGKKSLLHSNLWGGRVMGGANLPIFTRQLAGLVSSGLQIERALTALLDEEEDPKKRNLIATLRSEVNAGSTFAKALGQHPREFGEIYRSVVGAGEASGNMGMVLERLADEQEQSQALRSKLFGAALYPAIIAIFATAIVVLLMTYVVPQIAEVFTNSKQKLPTLTTIMLSISAFLRNYWWALILLFAAAAGVVYWLRSQTESRQRFDAQWLRLPIVGKLARGYNASRFASTLAMLTAAGVPIIKGLQAAAETLNNRAMRQDALDALVAVREGAPLASALAQKKRFPGLLPMFIRLGEQTGELPKMLERAAAQISGEVQRKSLRLATILEPLLIVGMGALVLIIVLSVLMPIIEMNQLVK